MSASDINYVENLIQLLLSNDSKKIRDSTNELQEAIRKNEIINALCQVTVLSKQSSIRQYAAILLKKRLCKCSTWQQLSKEQKDLMKTGMVQALTQEQELSVRNAMSQLIGVIVRHEANENDSWLTDLLTFVHKTCSSKDKNENELGSAFFMQLVDTAPDHFICHIVPICKMFSEVLTIADRENTLSSRMVSNFIIGMTYMVPFISGENEAEVMYEKTIPLIAKSLRAMSQLEEHNNFIKCFDIMESMSEFTPKIINAHMGSLLEFCLDLSCDKQQLAAVRVRVVSFLGWFVRVKRKLIIKLKFLEPVVNAIFELMCEESNIDEEEEYFSCSDTTGVVSTATQTMDMLALNLPPEKYFQPILRLLEPALKSDNFLLRRAAFMCMAVIAEGCADTICNSYLESMVQIIKAGCADKEQIVRNSAFFALGQFSEHLQPDISAFAPQIMPILLQSLQQMCSDANKGTQEPPHIDRMFYALETFCENLDDQLVPYLPLLMERLFESMSPQYSVRIRELTLCVISAAVVSCKQHTLPYLGNLIEILQIYFSQDIPEDFAKLRPHAVDTLASIARSIGRENFLPLANSSVNFVVVLLQTAMDPEIKRALYNLSGALATVAGDNIASIMPAIIEKFYASILSNEDVQSIEDEDAHPPLPDFDDDEDVADDSDKDMKSSEVDELEFTVENTYLDEKEEAISTLKEFADHAPRAFLPYLEKSFKQVYQVLAHPHEDIRKTCIEALGSFVICVSQHGEGASNACSILLPKLEAIIHKDRQSSVVLSAIDCIYLLLKKLGSAAITSHQLSDVIYTCIKDVINGKVNCLTDDTGAHIEDEDIEYNEINESIIESVAHVLPAFGKAMSTETFVTYFDQLYPFLLKRLEKAKLQDFDMQRSFIYCSLAGSFESLNNHTAKYFDTFYDILIGGLRDENESSRQNSLLALGELTFYSGSVSYKAFPHILSALIHCFNNEKVMEVMDNVCGTACRLILTNRSLVPLQQILPFVMKNLPIKNNFNENEIVLKCLHTLFSQTPETVEQFVEHIINCVFLTLYKNECKTTEAWNLAQNLLKGLQLKYPQRFDYAEKVNPVLTSIFDAPPNIKSP